MQDREQSLIRLGVRVERDLSPSFSPDYLAEKLQELQELADRYKTDQVRGCNEPGYQSVEGIRDRVEEIADSLGAVVSFGPVRGPSFRLIPEDVVEPGEHLYKYEGLGIPVVGHEQSVTA